MFQTFEPVSDRTFAQKHVPLLRAKLRELKLDGFIIPHDDEYQNEYIPAYAERLMWISGFSGSAGSAIVMLDRAVIFSDGRYTLQVRSQTDDACFEYADIPASSPAAWIKANARSGEKIGYDPMLHTRVDLERLEAAAAAAKCALVAVSSNPIDAAWTDQPARPTARVTIHDKKFAGRDSAVKRDEIAGTVKSANADMAVITAPPSIAWLFNLRGSDVSRTPLPLSRALVHANGKAEFFVDPAKVGNDLAEALGDDVDIKAEAAFDETLAAYAKADKRIALDSKSAPVRYEQILNEAGASAVDLTDPCALPRATKNDTEIAGARTAHIRDGAAVTQFLHWLDTSAQDGSVDEITAASKLEAFRTETGALVDLSFDSISGAGANGAIVHYRVTTETNRQLLPGELFLIDSGGQYRDGTTDITRTAPIGEPTSEMIRRFTLVLKGHISLATARFPSGTTGHQLDAFARRALWDAGLDYDHGTGHGVGSFLGVHEGPQRIATALNGQELLPGMILSNEPGYYKTDGYGIRIENLIVVSPPASVDGGEREMMSFETITLAPIDRRLIDASLLSDDERAWLDEYHARVFATLKDKVPADVSSWLEEMTRPLG